MKTFAECWPRVPSPSPITFWDRKLQKHLVKNEGREAWGRIRKEHLLWFSFVLLFKYWIEVFCSHYLAFHQGLTTLLRFAHMISLSLQKKVFWDYIVIFIFISTSIYHLYIQTYILPGFALYTFNLFKKNSMALI